MKTILNLEKIVKESNGLWISGLFSSIVCWNPGNDFLEYKDMFFTVIKKLLDEGVIRICHPENPLGKQGEYWRADSEVIIEYLQKYWPENISDKNDELLNLYFYEVPAILWLNESGDYSGS